MRFPFLDLPGRRREGLYPVLPVHIEGMTGTHPCLADTCSVHNRFGRWVADALDIDLAPAGEGQRIALGGFTTSAVPALVQLRLGDTPWEAPVWFCDPWPLGFQILGLDGFFRWFEVTVRGADHVLECTAEQR